MQQPTPRDLRVDTDCDATSITSAAINFTPILPSTSDLHSLQTGYTRCTTTQTYRTEDVFYADYYDYLCQIVDQHPDIETLKVYLEGTDDPSSERTAVHVIDFSSTDNTFPHPILHGTCTTAEEIQTLFEEQDDVVELRLVIISHEGEIDRDILKTVGYVLDIDPRVFIEHMGSVFPKPRSYFATPYLPSEAIKSPIEILFGGGRSTAILLEGTEDVPTNTVLVLIDSPDEDLEAALRDFSRPSLHKPHQPLSTISVPAKMNLTYRYLRRLSEFQASEVRTCCQHPIYLILPLLQLCCLETSMLLTWAEEKLYEARLQHNVYERDPYEAYVTSEGLQQEIFTSTVSLKTHTILPWIDTILPSSGVVLQNISCALKDLDFLKDKASLVQQSVTDALNRAAATESINEARQSVAQSESVNKITRLAFVFIPLTFATSLFGMNIREWQQEAEVPRLVSFVGTAIAITLLTILFAAFSGRVLRLVKGLWQGLGAVRAAFGCSVLLGGMFLMFSACHGEEANERLACSLGLLEEDGHNGIEGDVEWLKENKLWFGSWWYTMASKMYICAVKKSEQKDNKLAEKMV